MSVAESPRPGAAPARILELLAAAPARAGRTRVLAIDGRSGAGKSTLSAQVQQALSPAPGSALNPPIVHLEHLYPGWDGLADGVDRLLEWVLQPLARDQPARYRHYDWARAEYTDWIDVPASPVLIVEGVGAGARATARYLSVLVYLDLPEPIRYQRAISRDGETYRPHWRRWADQEEALFADDDPRGRADMIL